MYTILLIDGDKEIQQSLVEQFELYGDFKIVACDTATNALEIAKEEKIDTIITEIKLPDMDGREAIKIFRSNNFSAPIIILTKKKTDADLIDGLESGANDYITKPFKISVLIARLRARLREYNQSKNAVLTIGPYTFFVSQKILEKENGAKIALTEKETDILKYLHLGRQQCVSREKILNEVWGYHSGVTTHTLETHIYRLRQKIEENPAQEKFLCTCDGGYKLVTKI